MAASRGTKRMFETAFLLSAALSDDYKATFAEAEAYFREYRDAYIEGSQTMAERTADAFDAAEAAILATGVVDGIRAVADAYKECISAASEFEYTMSGVEAVSMASSSDMALLSDMALQLGAESKFTATQSAEAMTYMAQAGWAVQDMLSGMPGVINLAAASGEDLAQSSSILSDVLAGFQMEASESARAADVLAQAAAASNTSVLEMGETFQTSAALAGALGYTIEDVSAAVGLMANVGIKGSRAGTTLRNILGGFLGGATLEGASFGEVEFSAVNADGTVQSFRETVDSLREIFSQMTEAEKIANARTIAGERGYTGLVGILEATDEKYNEMYDSINNAAGAAERMAKIRMDNLAGDVEELNSAYEGLQITLGGQFQEEGRRVVQWMTDMTNAANEFIENNPKLVKQFAVLTAEAAGAAGAVALASGALALFKAIKGLAALMGGPVTLSIAAAGAVVGALTAGIITYISTAKEGYRELIDDNEELIESHRALNEEYSLALSEIEDTYTETGYLAEQVMMLAEAENRSAAEKELLSSLVDELNEKMPELGLVYDRNTDSLNMSTEALQAYIEKMYEEERQLERMQRLQDLYAQNKDYAEQLREAEEAIETAKAEREALFQQWADMGYSHGFYHNISRKDKEIAKMEDSMAELRAAYAASSWEYKSMMYEAEASAKPAEAVEAATVTDNSSGDTIINITADGTWTKEEWIRAMKESGHEVTEEVVAAIEEILAGRGAY